MSMLIQLYDLNIVYVRIYSEKRFRRNHYMDYLLLFLSGIIGLIAGLGSGFLGIGGGSIRIPLLNLIGFTLISSFGMNLLALPVSSIVGAATQKKNIDYKYGSYMILGGSAGTILGTLIAFSLVGTAILLPLIFVMVSLLSVVALNMNRIAPSFSEHMHPSLTTLSLSTFFSNTITGLRGGSEGSLFVPLLRFFNVDMHKAIATALFAAIFTSIVGASLYWLNEDITILYGIAVMVTSGLGAQIGSSVSIKTKPGWLQISLTIVILVLALIPLIKVFYP